MNKDISLKIRKSDGGILDLQFQTENQFRLLYFDHSGNPLVLGTMPLKVMRGPLRQWSRSWAAGQDFSDLEVATRKQNPHFDPQDALISLDKCWAGYMPSFSLGQEKRKTRIAFVMVKEIVRAILHRLTNVGDRVNTVWRFKSDSDKNCNYETILEWLFCRR